MQSVIFVTGTMKLVVVGAILVFNATALLQVCYRSRLCIHSLITTAALLANTLYLLTWLPFLTYGLLNAKWTIINEQVYCLSQNFVVTAMGLVLVSLLAVRMCDRVRKRVFRCTALSGTRAVFVVFAMWILPQLAYDLISFAGNHKLCKTPVFHFLDEIQQSPSTANVTVNDTTVITAKENISTTVYTFGFMICEQELSPVALTIHAWQYTVLVLPLAAIIAVCSLLLLVKAGAHSLKGVVTAGCGVWRSVSNNPQPTLVRPNAARARRPCRLLNLNAAPVGGQFPPTEWGLEPYPSCHTICRRRMIAIDLMLCSALAWQLLVRPLMVLHALYQHDRPANPPVFLDLGSHLILAISSVFIPLVCATSKQSAISLANDQSGRLPTSPRNMVIPPEEFEYWRLGVTKVSVLPLSPPPLSPTSPPPISRVPLIAPPKYEDVVPQGAPPSEEQQKY